MPTVEKYCGYCGTLLSAEGGEGNPRRRPSGWNTPVEMVERKFGSLLVLEQAEGTPRRWLCSCLKCGGTTTVLGDSLRRGLSRSCGCRMGKKEANNA